MSKTATSLSPSFIEADEALDFLHLALEDRHNRYSIANAMERIGFIFRSADNVTRYKIVTDLTELNYSRLVPFLIDVLENDPTPLVRHEAAFGIGVLGGARVAQTLARVLLCDESPTVRHESAIALAEIGSLGEIPALETATTDEDEGVALSATFAIQSILLYIYQDQRTVNE